MTEKNLSTQNQGYSKYMCLMGKQKGKPRGKKTKAKEFEFDRIIGYEIVVGKVS